MSLKQFSENKQSGHWTWCSVKYAVDKVSQTDKHTQLLVDATLSRAQECSSLALSHLCVDVHLSRLQQKGDNIQTSQFGCVVETSVAIFLLESRGAGEERKRVEKSEKREMEREWKKQNSLGGRKDKRGGQRNSHFNIGQ